MPTVSSSSTARCLASFDDDVPCTVIASATWRPTANTGFKAASAS
jgi:hypothetical protein